MAKRQVVISLLLIVVGTLVGMVLALPISYYLQPATSHTSVPIIGYMTTILLGDGDILSNFGCSMAIFHRTLFWIGLIFGVLGLPVSFALRYMDKRTT